MNTTSIQMIGAIVLGLLAAVAFAFPTSAHGEEVETSMMIEADANGSAMVTDDAPPGTGDVEITKDFVNSKPLTIMRSSIGAETGTSMNAASVTTDADLTAYATAAIQEDDQIDSVSFNDDSVEVSYYQEGKVIGMFPVTMTVKTKVASDGTVTVSYPWYRFLVATETNADVSAKVEERVAAWKASTTADAALTASAKAKLLDEIRAAVGAEATATVR